MRTFCIVTSANMDEYSGVQKFVLDLAEFIVNRGQQVTLVSRRNSISLVSSVTLESPHNVVFDGISSHLYARKGLPNNFVSSIISSIITIIVTVRVCNKNKAAIIHAQDVLFSGFAGVIAHKLFRVPLIVHAHGPSSYFFEGTSEATKLEKILAKLLAKVVMRNSDLVLATDYQTKNSLMNLTNKVKIRCIPTPINVRTYSLKKGRQAKRFSFSGMIIGSIGRLSPQKNLGTLLNAFASASAELNDETRLVIVGDGPEKNSLAEMAERLRLQEAILFVGTVTEGEKVELLKSFDIFVLPSLFEGCPISLLEAMASGKAIIASDIPAIREIVKNEKEALLFDPNDPEKLKTAIIVLCNNPKLREKLSEGAKSKVMQYDVNIVFSKMLGIYREILKD